jgi:hypothetical protein
MVSLLTVVLFLAGGASLDPGAVAQGKQGVKVGTLKCDVDSGWGLVFGSSKSLKCVYTPDGKKMSERYRGTIDKYGIDIGYTEAGIILWTVFAPTENVDRGALKGKYVGATAEATIAVGLGANVLVGGGNSIALQPLSISGQRGLNLAAGIASVELKAAR